jgi:hypothetical protein
LGEAALVRFFLFMAATLFLVGCHRDGGNNAEAALAEAYLQQLQGSHPGMTDACVQKIRTGEVGLTGWIDNPACFQMLPDQRWSGLWDAGWEWTNFCPDPAKQCGSSSEHGDIWLTFAKGADRGPDLADGVYRIVFVGRRTKVSGYFGHLDQYDHLMVVDRVISLEKIRGEKYTKRF